MRVHFTLRSDMTIYMENDDWPNGGRAERLIDELCRNYDCERISAPYTVGEGYRAQDILCRRTWRWYTIEYSDTEYKLRYKKVAKFPYKMLTPEMLMRQGIPADRDSLSRMGLKIRMGKIYVRGDP